MDARYRIQSANAAMLAGKLRILSAVKRVNYVRLKDNPYYALAQRQFSPTAGAMITIDLESKEACFAFISRLKLIRRATNLFTTIRRLLFILQVLFLDRLLINNDGDMDVLDTTIRFSIGLEDVDDLFDDVRQALDNKRIRSKNPKVIYETVNIPQNGI